MVVEDLPNPPTQSAGKLRKLREEIHGLKAGYETLRKELYQKVKKPALEKREEFREEHPTLSHPVSSTRISGKRIIGKTREFKERVSPPSEGPWFVLVKIRKDNTWELHGTYYSEQERDNAINEIKSSIRSRRGIYSEYYTTTNLKEVHRFLKVSAYRERRHQAELRKEISRLPTGRWTENIQRGLQIPKEREISKELAELSREPRGRGIPRMIIGAWGSQLPPKRTQVPSFGARARRPTKQPAKRIVSHDEYQELLNEGYTREDLDTNGIVDRYSRHYQEESVFGRGVVPYRPVSFYQTTLPRPTLPKTPFEQRIAEGRPYELFKPFPVEFKKVEFKKIFKWW